jgi:oxygen-independent coproporphyrinogen-3 oxidase
LLYADELNDLLDTIRKNYTLEEEPEITIEANPDDLTPSYLSMLAASSVNRLSIGIQSFRDEDLAAMNRAHNSTQALRCVQDAASAGFNNLSIDLMFGWPGLSMDSWKENVRTALELPITHLSCYGLTVEERTVLKRKIMLGEVSSPDEGIAAGQYLWLLEAAESAGIPWYEISNFSRTGFASRHNTSYWTGAPYLGIGPSAHSFNGTERSWNVSSNSAYVQSWESGERAAETEFLTGSERFNEYILTSMRMRQGIDLSQLTFRFGQHAHDAFMDRAAGYLTSGALHMQNGRMAFSTQGLLFADRITAELFTETV